MRNIASRVLLTFATIFIFTFCSFAQNDTIRILAIGNSFSEDAVENYLYDIAKADGVVLIIGNMYIGGCSLERHWTNASTDSAAYSYRKRLATGELIKKENTKLKDAITDEKWNYITFQQVSQLSGIYDSYFPYLRDLLDYTKPLATNDDVRYAMHMTWAYAQDSSHKGFANYHRSQPAMYNAIVNSTYRVAKDVGIDIVIPTGTAIQNGRGSTIGDNFCRDGYHLDKGIGRFTAACTWYVKLCGGDIAKNTYIPDNISYDKVLIAKKAVVSAIEFPKNVTFKEE